MEDKEYNLRKTIRMVLENQNNAKLTDDDDIPDNVGSWWLYEEFAMQLLRQIGYTGNSSEAIYKTKEAIEKNEGWTFDRF